MVMLLFKTGYNWLKGKCIVIELSALNISLSAYLTLFFCTIRKPKINTAAATIRLT